MRLCAEKSTCTMISSVYLAHYGDFRAKDPVSVDCGMQNLTKSSFPI